MEFLINGEHYSLCKPYLNQHVWTWAGGDTLGECWPDKLCDCGAIKYKDRDRDFRDVQSHDYLRQEED